MENLPLLFLRKLFRLMPSLNEAIKCSHVCRNWRAAYEAMIKPETLCLDHESYIHVSYRLFYSNDRLFKMQFLRLHQPSIYLSFFDSGAAAIHFANLKKLVIFYPIQSPNPGFESRCKFRFKDQFNAFKSLEYFEIWCDILALEGCQIDLPRLKILSWAGEFRGAKQIALNTPSLEAMRVYTDIVPENSIKIVNFEFKCPQSLKHLKLNNFETNFKFDFSVFVNLECLVFRYVGENVYQNNRDREIRLFADDFLQTLPNLKFLFFDQSHFEDDVDLPKLIEEKQKFNLKGLKILPCSRFENFSYLNCSRNLQYKHHLKYWPSNFRAVFDHLITSQVQLDHFKEGYFRIGLLEVG